MKFIIAIVRSLTDCSQNHQKCQKLQNKMKQKEQQKDGIKIPPMANPPSPNSAFNLRVPDAIGSMVISDHIKTIAAATTIKVVDTTRELASGGGGGLVAVPTVCPFAPPPPNFGEVNL